LSGDQKGDRSESPYPRICHAASIDQLPLRPSHNYNAAAGLCVICPITSRVRGYPFEAPLPDSASFRGVVLADQPHSISWEKRPVTHAGRAADIVLTEVRERLAALLGID